MNKKINFDLNGISYTLINTKKYKVISGIISFIKPLEIEELTYYSFISRLINSSCAKYPTKNALSNKMYELYDCTAYMNVNFTYKTVNCSFCFSTINSKYTKNPNLFKDCIELIKEMMLNPLIENNGFNIKNFKEEKKGLETDIRNIYNNKIRYANSQFLKSVYPNNIMSESSLGNLDVLQKITPEDLLDFYKKLLNDSMINVGIIGDITKEEVISYFNDFKLPSKKINTERQPLHVEYKENVTKVQEYQDIFQARMVVGFKHNVSYYSKDYYALIVFDAMFGGIFGSSLFMNIRENHSLTYDISSSCSFSKKLFCVTCGVDKKNIEITSDLIIKEFENYCNGNIDENLLSKAKDYIVNDLKDVEDYPFSSLTFAIESVISNRPAFEETISGIKSVTKEDVINVCQKMKLDTIYTLLPGDENE